MIIEAGTHLIESIPTITTAVGLLIGAVRVISTKGFKLDILEGRRGKKQPRITKSGQAIIPDGKSATVGVFSKEGGLQTCINVIDTTKGNLEASNATITGSTRHHIATLSRKKRKFLLEGDLLFRYIH